MQVFVQNIFKASVYVLFLVTEVWTFFVDLIFSVGLTCLCSDRYDVCETHVNNIFFRRMGTLSCFCQCTREDFILAFLDDKGDDILLT